MNFNIYYLQLLKELNSDVDKRKHTHAKRVTKAKPRENVPKTKEKATENEINVIVVCWCARLRVFV